MSLLLLIVLAIVLATLWKRMDRLQDRLDAMEEALAAAVRPYTAPFVPPEPMPMPTPVSVPAPPPPPPPPPPAARPEQAPRPAPVVERPRPPASPWLPPITAEPEASAPNATGRGGFEELFGRRLPIWAGGLTLAVAGVLIVRYSIEAGLLSPWVRVVLGLLFGIGLIGGAEAALRREDTVRDPRVRQSLAGAGIATLYAVTLAAANLYGLIGPVPAFVGMALVTVLAAGLSLRFGAPSAVLGLLGGLAAPALVGVGEPDVPLLTLYLALTVGGLCALGRQQRWWWLGGAALIGGFGWGAVLILGGVLDLAATLSVGIYTLGLAIGLPLLLTGHRAAAMRVAASLLGCAQLAALVTLGGFAPLHWALFGLISLAILWLSRRDAAFADLPAPALAVAILLALAWPDPSAAACALVLAAIAAIHALPAALRVWRADARPIDAPMVAGCAIAIGIVPAIRFDDVGWTALVAAALAAAVAAKGWRVPGRQDDGRFAILAVTATAMLGLAAALLLSVAAWASAAALLCVATLALADAAHDRRVEGAAWLFGVVTLLLLAGDPGVERLFGDVVAGRPGVWIVPALAAMALALRAPGPRARVMQPAAVLLGYGAAAQMVPGSALSLVPVAALLALAASRRADVLPAGATAAVLAAGWVLTPLLVWTAAAADAATGSVVPVAAWPTLHAALLDLALPGVAGLAAGWLLPVSPLARRTGTAIGGVLLALAAHVALQHAVGIDTAAAFQARTLMERTLWEALLAVAAVAAWRFGGRRPAIVLGAAALLHAAWFTCFVLNPLIVMQRAGPWLVLSYAVAGGLLWVAPRALPQAIRWRDAALMLLGIVAAFTLLRQASHDPMPLWTGTGAGEQIARSILALALAGAFLGVGIVRRARDWRLASLVLMLVAVVKVFLFDAAGLDGLARIASFVALGFSLIGVGWLYSRYLPDEAR